MREAAGSELSAKAVAWNNTAKASTTINFLMVDGDISPLLTHSLGRSAQFGVLATASLHSGQDVVQELLFLGRARWCSAQERARRDGGRRLARRRRSPQAGCQRFVQLSLPLLLNDAAQHRVEIERAVLEGLHLLHVI